MRKIVSYRAIALHLFLSLIFAAIWQSIKEPVGFFETVIFMLSFTLSGCFFVVPFVFPNHIL